MNDIFNNKKDLTMTKCITIKESLSNLVEKTANENDMSYSKVINLILEKYFEDK